MDLRPMVSVLMTAYNREKYIAEAIESVLASSYNNFELIIVDDASSDKSVEIAKSYEVKDTRIEVYVNQRNLGDYPNRNKAASYAKGKYIKYVDSDDLIYPNSLEHMVEVMEKYPEAGYGFSTRHKDTTSDSLLTPREAYYCHFFVKGILDLGPTALIYNKNKFDQIGRFKVLRNVSDFDLSLRLASQFPVVEMKAGLVYWREHENQEIRLDPEKYLEFGLQIIKDAFAQGNCPLRTEEILLLLKKQRKLYSVGILKGALRTGQLVKYWSFWNKNKLSPFDLF
jgi:glycosyltransferase involved in cell wall biosynthesis